MSLFKKVFEDNHDAGNNYPDAGERAQPEVQQAIERFRKLSDEEKENKVLLYWLLGEGTPDYKMAPDDAAYQDSPQGKQKCANCEFAYKKVVKDQFICSQISGDIAPEAWCRLWKAPQ